MGHSMAWPLPIQIIVSFFLFRLVSHLISVRDDVGEVGNGLKGVDINVKDLPATATASPSGPSTSGWALGWLQPAWCFGCAQLSTWVAQRNSTDELAKKPKSHQTWFIFNGTTGMVFHLLPNRITPICEYHRVSAYVGIRYTLIISNHPNHPLSMSLSAITSYFITINLGYSLHRSYGYGSNLDSYGRR